MDDLDKNLLLHVACWFVLSVGLLTTFVVLHGRDIVNVNLILRNPPDLFS